MSYLRGSANYVWCTTSVLGKGATGAVFQGVSKHDGEPVAVKTFNQLSHMRPQEVQVREFEVLKKVKHENIVKLLAIEEEQDQRGKVIVMELCTGGSLFNILDDPENSYGLDEDEFLLVLGHLAAGMKHLRDNNLVHRDLKPGNIMKFVAEDGRIIYKLTDFGAARELEEDGEFMSLYGTEEYLHPDLYERAVLRKPMGKSYTAFVDLWSIGVTLFHVATGFLPFRPFGGRKNKEMMYYIVTKKESGVISGSQSSENGAVEWKRELPSSCQLSAGLKIHIVPLLAGLMEVDTRKRWAFDSFFGSVTSLLRRRKVHVFFVNRIQSLRIYVDLEEQKHLSSFQCLVMEQTDISPEKQIFLYKDRTLAAILDHGKKYCSEIPETTEHAPLVLCHRENNNISMEWDTKDLVKFPSFPNLVNVENDASLAKHICGIGYSYRRRIQKICLSVDLINQAVKTMVQVIVAELTSLHKDSSQVQTVISSLSQQLGLMGQFHKTCQFFLDFSISSPTPTTQIENKEKVKILQTKIDSMNQSMETQYEEFRGMSAHLLTLEQPVNQLHNRFVDNQVLMNEWNEAASDIKDISRASIKATTHVTKLRDSWQHLLRDRATRSLTYNDEQFHILERIKMQEKAKCLTALLNEETQQVIARLTEVFSDWYKTASCAFIQTEILEKDMFQFQDNLQLFLLKLNDAVELFQNDLETLTLGLKNVEHNQNQHQLHSNQTSVDTGYQPDVGREEDKLRKGSESTQSKSSRTEYVRTFNRGLKELTHVQEEVWNILKENAELVNQFQTLTLSILSPDGNQNFENNQNNYKHNSNSSLLSLTKE